MYKLVTNDSSAYALTMNPYESIIQKRGVDKKVLCIAFGQEIDTLAKVKEICTDELKMSVITVFEDSVQIREEKDYTVLEQITTATVNVDGKEVDVLVAKMSKTTSIPEQIMALENQITVLTGKNESLSQENSVLNSNLDAVTNSCRNLSEQVSQLTVKNEELVENNSTLSEDLNKMDEICSELNQQVSELTESNKKLAEENSTMLIKLEEAGGAQLLLFEQVSQLTVKNEELVNANTSLNETIVSMRYGFTELQENYSELVNRTNDNTESLEIVSRLQNVATENSEHIKMIEESLNVVDEDALTLDELKEYRITLSKVNLATYLETHTVTSDAHGGVVAEYGMTQDKQSQLMAVIMMATLNENYTPSWNASGEVCTYDWTLDELQKLAGDIEAVVRPLVAQQQTVEVEIKNASTIEDVKAISIEFN